MDKQEPTLRVNDAKAHLDEALQTLTLEAYRGRDPKNMQRVDDFTIAEDLERIDCAIGPRGESIFAKIAANIRLAYVEIKAARQALESSNG
jgi:hypothetical protein